MLTPGGSSTVLPFLSAFFNLLTKAIAIASLCSCAPWCALSQLVRALALAHGKALVLLNERDAGDSPTHVPINSYCKFSNKRIKSHG